MPTVSSKRLWPLQNLQPFGSPKGSLQLIRRDPMAWQLSHTRVESPWLGISQLWIQFVLLTAIHQQNSWTGWTPKNPQIPSPHWFPLYPYWSRDSRSIRSSCCSIPWRSGEQNQQNQWGTTLQILSLPINRNSHPARQCLVCHGYNWFNGKTWRIKLPITYSTLSILTQWRASRSLKLSNLIILFNTVNIHSSKSKKMSG